MKVLGLYELFRKLEAVPSQYEKDLRQAVSSSAKQIRAAARRNVPVGKYKGGGQLKKNIKIRYSKDGLSAQIGFDRTTFYGRFLEFGTKPNGKHRGITRKPFLHPAFKENRPKFRGRVHSAIRRNKRKL